MHENIKKIIHFFTILVIIYVIGILGYVIIEKYNFLDALYMTMITISTVGFREVAPLSQAGKIFTIVLIMLGVTLVVYGLGSITSFIIEGEMRKFIRGMIMDKTIKKLKGHYIICGAGRTGSKIIEEMKHLKRPFVVIESDENRIKEILEEYIDILIIKGDATRDEILIEAGIDHASFLVGVLSSDADNLFLTLTGKYLNNNIKIVTRAIESNSEKKLRKAGADYIISALDIAANRIVSIVTNPEVVSFFDVVRETGIEGLKFELVEISEKSPLQKLSLKDAQLPQKTNLIIIGIRKHSEMHINPMYDTILESGNKLLVLGNERQIEKLRELALGK